MQEKIENLILKYEEEKEEFLQEYKKIERELDKLEAKIQAVKDIKNILINEVL